VSLIEQVRVRPSWLMVVRGRVAVVCADVALLACALTGRPGQLAALLGSCLLGFAVFQARRTRRIAGLGAGLAAAGTLLLAADHVLSGTLPAASAALATSAAYGAPAVPDPTWPERIAGALEVLSAVLLLPAVLIGTCLAAVLLGRALRRPADFSWVRRAGDPGGELNVVPSPSVVGADGRAFPGDALPTPRPDRDLERPAAALALCASGGGIRSASVTLGALQALRGRGLLHRARYLVSVSGGGFTAGAFQLAMNPLPDFGEGEPRIGVAVTDPERVFSEGSVEEDHIRRHGKYVADAGGEWAAALGALLRGAGASLALLAGVVCVFGVVLGVFYRLAPLAAFDYGYPFTPGAGDHPPGFPPVPDGVLLATAIPVALGLLSWFAVIALMSFAGTASTIGRQMVIGSFSLAAAVLLLGVAMPAVVWCGTRAVWWLDSVSSLNAAQLATGGAAGTVTLAYLGSLSSILWRGRRRISGVGRFFGRGGALRRRVPSALSQRITVWTVLVAIAALYALLFGAVVRVASKDHLFAGPVTSWGWWPQWFLIGACAGFVLVTALVDETWMSLHWFYRRRLATAFAVRRLDLGPNSEAAQPYDFEREATRLSTYGARREGFPQVIFSAAAHLSGADRSPPGRNAVSFSLSSDWVGGPQVGYLRTAALEHNLGSNLRMDLTVQTAVAVSGAAFASAMGVQARAYQTLLALSNARLGTWLPNPAWLYRRCGAGDWTQPRLPRVRRISYLLREVLGVYDQRDRLLLVTDGGHYDNTGLVELLRHRVRTAICIDSSGDSPPFAQALGRAISLAREELGVSIDLHDPLGLVPGSGRPMAPDRALASVNARLSRAAVVVGTITYPEAFVAPDEVGPDGGPAEPSATGFLVVAKLALTEDMPYDVLAFAATDHVFPYDSTGDQWFDEGQFNAYHGLGRCLGEKAADALAPVPSPAAPAVPAQRAPSDQEVRLA
jgi:hypothetical protein